MKTIAALTILNRIFTLAAPTLLLLSFSFEIRSDGTLSILWRDNTILALSFAASGLLTGLGWIFYLAAIASWRRPGKPFVSSRGKALQRRVQHFCRHGTSARNGTIQEVRTQSLGLGMQRNRTFSEVVVPILASDSLCLYTDGVTEATNKRGKEFGVERLRRLISIHGALSTDTFSYNTIHAVRRFAGKKESHDDATVLSIRLTAVWGIT